MRIALSISFSVNSPSVPEAVGDGEAEGLGDGLGEADGEHGETLIVLHVAFSDFGNMQRVLETKNIIPVSAEVEWIPGTTVTLSEEYAQDVLKLVDKLEQDEDVLKVFHNLV